MEIFMYIINIIAYFIVYSFIGWALESIYKSIFAKRFINSGFLNGPFCPIYGTGALIMYYFLSGYNENPVYVFIIGFVILSVWEYVVAWALEKFFNEKYWDYSDYKFNLNGRVCLLNSVFWGILGVIFIYIVHPFIETQIDKINDNILISITIVISIYIITETILSIIKLKGIQKKLDDIRELRNQITHKLMDLKKLGDTAKLNNKDALQQIIDGLKEQERMMREKLIKQTERFRKAFPTMQSDRFKQIANYRRNKRK